MNWKKMFIILIISAIVILVFLASSFIIVKNKSKNPQNVQINQKIDVPDDFKKEQLDAIKANAEIRKVIGFIEKISNSTFIIRLYPIQQGIFSANGLVLAHITPQTKFYNLIQVNTIKADQKDVNIGQDSSLNQINNEHVGNVVNIENPEPSDGKVEIKIDDIKEGQYISAISSYDISGNNEFFATDINLEFSQNAGQ